MNLEKAGDVALASYGKKTEAETQTELKSKAKRPVKRPLDTMVTTFLRRKSGVKGCFWQKGVLNLLTDD